MRQYELYLVLDADAEEETVSATLDRVTELITTGHGEQNGEVVKVDTRGKRRLAYPIQKKTESQDFILTFHTPPQALPEIERFLKLEELVFRYLIVRTDET